jgi:hypothetical protein
MQMDITHYGKATITFTLTARNGTLTGEGDATYYAAGNTAYFTGTLAIVHGSRAYSHAHGRGLSIEGTFQRSTFAVSVRVMGRFSK